MTAIGAGHPTLEFLGAAGTVTGSMHLVRANGRRILLDCGLFQGQKDLRVRNWGERVPDPRTIDAVVLSHVHVDHSGYLPLLAREGFRGPIFCTSGTADLLEVVLPDAAHLQEEEAERANRHAYSKHQPALPLYTGDDAQAVLRLVQHRDYDVPFPVVEGANALLRRAGHILGSATVTAIGFSESTWSPREAAYSAIGAWSGCGTAISTASTSPESTISW